MLAAYLLAVAFGASTSSISMPHLTESAQELTAAHLGDLQPIRSDEYNVFTPVQMSMLATGGEPTLSPLSTDASIVLRYPHGPVQSVVYWDTLLLRLGPWLPDAQLFAAHWWLPTLLILLCMPTWTVLMGGRRELGWMAGALVALAPSNFWWSMQPSMVLAYTLLGCTLMLAAASRAARGQRLLPALQCLAAGLCIAGLPSNYLAWSILLGGGVLLASSVKLIADGRRTSLVVLGATGVIAALLGLGALVEGLEGLRSVTSTVYPGQRRSSAEPVGLGMLFGAPLLAALQGSEPIFSNKSELSTAFTVSLVLVPFAWAASGAGLRDLIRRDRLAETVLALWGMATLLWCSVTIGSLGERIPVASSITPMRAAQVVGVIGVIALSLALSRVRIGRTGTAAAAGAVVALLTISAGSELRRDALPEMGLAMLWAAGLLVGAVAAGLIARPRSALAPIVAAAAALSVVVTASPLQLGLGDLGSSATARTLNAEGRTARANGTLWASDSGPFDVVMLSQGVPSITGLQRSGPNLSLWRRIDPDGRFENAWNRGGGYSAWHFEEGAPTRIETDGYDLIITTIDPCTLADAFPELGTIASTSELSRSTCLRPSDTLRWNGQDMHIYEVVR